MTKTATTPSRTVIHFREDPRIVELARLAAHKRFLTLPEWIRYAIRNQLQEDMGEVSTDN